MSTLGDMYSFYTSLVKSLLGVADLDQVIARYGNKSDEFCAQWQNEGVRLNMLVHYSGIAAQPPDPQQKRKEELDVIYTTDLLGSFCCHIFSNSTLVEQRGSC